MLAANERVQVDALLAWRQAVRVDQAAVITFSQHLPA